MTNEALNFIARSLEQVAAGALKVLQTTTFDVNVSNFPKTHQVKGTVTVGNQNNLEKLLRTQNKLLVEIRDAVRKKPEAT